MSKRSKNLASGASDHQALSSMILADTSGLLALLDAGEPRHDDVRRAVESDSGPLLTIDFVLAETDFLVRSRLGDDAGRAFLAQVCAGALQREPVTPADLSRAAAILEQFADKSFGLTDATLMAVAERLGTPILTLDRRHFGVFRTEKATALALLP